MVENLKKIDTCSTCSLCQGRMLNWIKQKDSDILFLSDFPRFEDAERGAFQGGPGKTFQNIVKIVIGRNFPSFNFKISAGYTLQCGLVGKENAKKKPNKADMKNCEPFLKKLLDEVNPKIIVPMGKMALESLGVPITNIREMRGKFIDDVEVFGKTYRVFPTFHHVQTYVSPGLTKTFMMDLRNLMSEVAMSTGITDEERRAKLKEITAGYDFPEIEEEFVKLEKKILHSEKHPIAVDTETNSLAMWLPTSKCICFSVSWAERKSAAWLLNHRELAAEDPLEIWKRLAFTFNILMSPNPKVAHNFQFDLQVFRNMARYARFLYDISEEFHAVFPRICRYSIQEIEECNGIRNVTYDSMLGEHASEEDKKGFYGLKATPLKYNPIFASYESALKESSEGEAVKLRTFKDYIAYVSQEEEFVERKEKLSTFGGWFEQSELEPPSWSEGLLPEDYQSQSFLHVYDLLAKSSKKRLWMKELRKKFDKKEDYELFKKRPFDVEPQTQDSKDMCAWVWMQKNKKKDFLKAEIKSRARQLKEIYESEREGVNFEDFPVEELLVYAAIDTDLCLEVAIKQIAALRQEEKEKPSLLYGLDKRPTSLGALKKISLPVMHFLSDAVHNGVNIDYEYMDKIDQAYKDTAAQEQEKLHEYFDDSSINLNSNKEVTTAFLKKGVEFTERTDGGQIAITKAILKGFSSGIPEEQFNPFTSLLSYKESLKASGTFIKNFRAFSEADGRVHPSFHQIGTNSYRLSSSRPNFQNIPKKLAGQNVKRCIIPSKPGNIIVNIDAAGAEVKSLTAYLSKLPGDLRGQSLIEEMNADIKFDMHSRFCAYIFGPDHFGLDVSTPDKWKESYLWVRENKDNEDIPLVKALRGKVKAVVFGTLYGQTAHGLSNLLGIPKEEAEYIIKQFFAADPSIEAYVKWSQKFVARHGYITTLLGRRRRFPLARLDRKNLSKSMRQATNFLIQSLTVDLFNYLASQFIPVLRKELDGLILLQVHDAIVFEMPLSNLSKLQGMFREHFEFKLAKEFPFFPVPFVCDLEIGDSYGTIMGVDSYLKGLKEEIIRQDDGVDERLRLAEEDPDRAHLVEDL